LKYKNKFLYFDSIVFSFLVLVKKNIKIINNLIPIFSKIFKKSVIYNYCNTIAIILLFYNQNFNNFSLKLYNILLLVNKKLIKTFNIKINLFDENILIKDFIIFIKNMLYVAKLDFIFIIIINFVYIFGYSLWFKKWILKILLLVKLNINLINSLKYIKTISFKFIFLKKYSHKTINLILKFIDKFGYSIPYNYKTFYIKNINIKKYPFLKNITNKLNNMVKIFNKISKLFLILDQLISFLKIFFFITSINKNSIIYINIIFNFINLYLSHNLKSLKFFEIYVKKPILIIKNLKNKNDFLHLKTHFIKKFIKIKKNKKKLNYIFKNKKIKIYNNIKSNIKIWERYYFSKPKLILPNFKFHPFPVFDSICSYYGKNTGNPPMYFPKISKYGLISKWYNVKNKMMNKIIEYENIKNSYQFLKKDEIFFFKEYSFIWISEYIRYVLNYSENSLLSNNIWPEHGLIRKNQKLSLSDIILNFNMRYGCRKFLKRRYNWFEHRYSIFIISSEINDLKNDIDYFFYFDFTEVFVKFLHKKLFWGHISVKLGNNDYYKFFNEFSFKKSTHVSENKNILKFMPIFSYNNKNKENKIFIKKLKKYSNIFLKTYDDLELEDTSFSLIFRNLFFNNRINRVNLKNISIYFKYLLTSFDLLQHMNILTTKLSKNTIYFMNEYLDKYYENKELLGEKLNSSLVDVKKNLYAIQSFKNIKETSGFPKAYKFREYWVKFVVKKTSVIPGFVDFLENNFSLFIKHSVNLYEKKLIKNLNYAKITYILNFKYIIDNSLQWFKLAFKASYSDFYVIPNFNYEFNLKHELGFDLKNSVILEITLVKLMNIKKMWNSIKFNVYLIKNWKKKYKKILFQNCRFVLYKDLIYFENNFINYDVLFKKASKYLYWGFSDIFFKNFKFFLKKKIEKGKSFVSIGDKLRIFSNILLDKNRFGIFKNPTIFTIENHFFLLPEYFYGKNYTDFYFINKLVEMLSMGIFTDKFLEYESLNQNISKRLFSSLDSLYFNLNIKMRVTPKIYSNYIIKYNKILNKIVNKKNTNFNNGMRKSILLGIKLTKIYKKKKISKLYVKFNRHKKKKTIPRVYSLEKYVWISKIYSRINFLDNYLNPDIMLRVKKLNFLTWRSFFKNTNNFFKIPYLKNKTYKNNSNFFIKNIKYLLLNLYILNNLGKLRFKLIRHRLNLMLKKFGKFAGISKNYLKNLGFIEFIPNFKKSNLIDLFNKDQTKDFFIDLLFIWSNKLKKQIFFKNLHKWFNHVVVSWKQQKLTIVRFRDSIRSIMLLPYRTSLARISHDFFLIINKIQPITVEDCFYFREYSSYFFHKLTFCVRSNRISVSTIKNKKLIYLSKLINFRFFNRIVWIKNKRLRYNFYFGYNKFTDSNKVLFKHFKKIKIYTNKINNKNLYYKNLKNKMNLELKILNSSISDNITENILKKENLAEIKSQHWTSIERYETWTDSSNTSLTSITSFEYRYYWKKAYYAWFILRGFFRSYRKLKYKNLLINKKLNYLKNLDVFGVSFPIPYKYDIRFSIYEDPYEDFLFENTTISDVSLIKYHSDSEEKNKLSGYLSSVTDKESSDNEQIGRFYVKNKRFRGIHHYDFDHRNMNHESIKINFYPNESDHDISTSSKNSINEDIFSNILTDKIKYPINYINKLYYLKNMDKFNVIDSNKDKKK